MEGSPVAGVMLEAEPLRMDLRGPALLGLCLRLLFLFGGMLLWGWLFMQGVSRRCQWDVEESLEDVEKLSQRVLSRRLLGWTNSTDVLENKDGIEAKWLSGDASHCQKGKMLTFLLLVPSGL